MPTNINYIANVLKRSESEPKQSEPVLLVVDCHLGNPASEYPPLIETVKKLIREFMQRNFPIMPLEFASRWDPHFESRDNWRIHRGKTHNALMDLLFSPRRYAKLHIVEKFFDDSSARPFDGSLWVSIGCRERGFSVDNVCVCGVNTDACVLQTVMGLVEMYCQPRVTVVTNACNTMTGEYDWSSFPKNERISLLSSHSPAWTKFIDSFACNK